MPHLRLPRAVVTGELVKEDERVTAPRLFVVQTDLVVGDGVRHWLAPVVVVIARRWSPFVTVVVTDSVANAGAGAEVRREA